MKTIIINPRFNCESVAGAFVLYSERKNTIISDANFYKILSKISEGFNTEDDLINELAGSMSVPEVLYFIQELEKNKVITEKSDEFTDEEAAFWAELDIDTVKLGAVLQNNTISVRAINSGKSMNAFSDVFFKNNIKTGGNSLLDVILTDDYESHELEAINKKALQTKRTWMLIKPSGSLLWIGPIFKPGKTGCWKCLEHRVALNKNIQAFVKRLRGNEVVKFVSPMTASTLQIAAHIASLEIIKYIYFNRNANLEGNLISFDTDKLITQVHTLVRRPQCPACGNPEIVHTMQNKSILLDYNDDNQNLVRDGGFRTALPESTVEKYKHHISPITGVVQTLEQIPDKHDSPVFNYFSGANMALQSNTLYWLNNHIRSFSGGKGKSHSQAKAGALCEAIERYSCSYQGGEDVFTAAYVDLGEKAIHPHCCLNFSKTQYSLRAQLNAHCLKYYFMIPGEFDEQEKMDWVKINLLGTFEYKYVPANYCFFQYPVRDEAKRFCFPDSNGNAAGNTLEEAILQGLLELIERDSVAIWWYNMLNCPAVDLESFNDNYFNQLAGYYKTIKRSLYAIDLTFDLNIPCFAAISHEHEGEKPLIGFGAHTDSKIALERALIELNQFLPVLYNAHYSSDPAIANWLDTATLDNQPHLIPHATNRKTYTDYSSERTTTITEAIKYCQASLKKKGLDIYYLNMTKPDIELPVAKVIVPGLRHFWKRLGPGRLYDVPVEMKLLKESKKEEELNPVSVFF